GLGQRLESARHGDLAIEYVGAEHLGGDLVFLERLGELQLLDLVEKLEHCLVLRVAERAEGGRREAFAAALAAIEVDVEQIIDVKLQFDPRAAVRNDAEGVKLLAVKMRGTLEA